MFTPIGFIYISFNKVSAALAAAATRAFTYLVKKRENKLTYSSLREQVQSEDQSHYWELQLLLDLGKWLIQDR